jgi:uncharacterized protein YydD (DUF2326 family)
VCFTPCHGGLSHDKIKKRTFSGTTFTYKSPVLTFFKTKIQTLKNKRIKMADTYIPKGNQQISQIGSFL